MGVHHVKALAFVASAQVPRGMGEGSPSGRELVQLDLQLHVCVSQCLQRADLVAHEATPLGVSRVSEHVGQHERAHER